LYVHAAASSLTLVVNNFGVLNMKRKYAYIAAMIGFAAQGNAATSTISPALAACSRALVESIRAEPLPAYTVKLKTGFVKDISDRNSYTVLAHSKKTKALLGKASCKATPAGEIVEFKSLPVKS
jgi:hypothetical protein